MIKKKMTELSGLFSIMFLITAVLNAEYTEDFITKYGLPGGTTEQIAQILSKEMTIESKKYRLMKMREEMSPEDNLYDLKVYLKEGVERKIAEKVLKKYSCKIMEHKEESRMCFVKCEGIVFSEKESKDKIGDILGKLRKEEIVDGIEMNYLAVGGEGEYIGRILRVTFGKEVKEEEVLKILRKYGYDVIGAKKKKEETSIEMGGGEEEEEENKYRIDTGTGTTTPQAMSKLIKEKAVIDITPDYLAYIPGMVNEPSDFNYAWQWYLEQESDVDIDMEGAWSMMESSRIIRIAVIDTGIEADNAELEKVLEKDEDNKENNDKEGHGTGIAGIIGAESNNSQGIAGTCWNGKEMLARIISIKITDDESGIATTEDAVEGIKRALKRKAEIINMSFVTVHTNALEKAIEKAKAKGVILIASAGNWGMELKQKSDEEKERKQLIYPGIFEGVINVGSVNKIGVRSIFSNYGEKVDVYAPGEDIYTTALNNEYRAVSGTSYAAPIVTGIVALMKSQYPKLTAEEIKQILKNTTKNGMVNAKNTIERVLKLSSTEHRAPSTEKGQIEITAKKEERIPSSKMGVVNLIEENQEQKHKWQLVKGKIKKVDEKIEKYIRPKDREENKNKIILDDDYRLYKDGVRILMELKPCLTQLWYSVDGKTIIVAGGDGDKSRLGDGILVFMKENGEIKKEYEIENGKINVLFSNDVMIGFYHDIEHTKLYISRYDLEGNKIWIKEILSKYKTAINREISPKGNYFTFTFNEGESGKPQYKTYLCDKDGNVLIKFDGQNKQMVSPNEKFVVLLNIKEHKTIIYNVETKEKSSLDLKEYYENIDGFVLQDISDKNEVLFSAIKYESSNGNMIKCFILLELDNMKIKVLNYNNVYRDSYYPQIRFENNRIVQRYEEMRKDKKQIERFIDYE